MRCCSWSPRAALCLVERKTSSVDLQLPRCRCGVKATGWVSPACLWSTLQVLPYLCACPLQLRATGPPAAKPPWPPCMGSLKSPAPPGSDFRVVQALCPPGTNCWTGALLQGPGAELGVVFKWRGERCSWD